MRSNPRPALPGLREQGGFTLVELMISLVLGLLVIAAAGSLFLSNRRVYGSTEAINRIQENQRTAYELLARDLREAGSNPCMRFSSAVRPVVLLAAPNSPFWTNFSNGLVGTEGGTTDSVTVYLANSGNFRVTGHSKPGDPLTVSSTAGIVNGMTVMVCNTDYAIAFNATNVTSGGTTLGHSNSSGSGNCGSALTYSPDYTQCSSGSAGPGYCFAVPGVPPGTPTAGNVSDCPAGIGRSPAYVVRPFSAQWTVESNGRGGTSLYRTDPSGRNEVAEGVSSLQLTYKVGTSAAFQDAAAVTAASQWGDVTAVRLVMTLNATTGALSSRDVQGTDNAVLTRVLEDVISLRNHVDVQ